MIPNRHCILLVPVDKVWDSVRVTQQIHGQLTETRGLPHRVPLDCRRATILNLEDWMDSDYNNWKQSQKHIQGCSGLVFLLLTVVCAPYTFKGWGKRFLNQKKLEPTSLHYFKWSWTQKHFNRFEHEIKICLDVQVTSFLADPLLVLARTNA